MSSLHRIAVGVVASAALLAVPGAVVTNADNGSQAVDRVIIRGNVEQRLRLTAEDLAALPQQTLTVTFVSGTTPQTHTYTGPLLLDVLNLAGPEFDPAIKNDKLQHYAEASGSDGYQAIVAWGELDPDFEGKQLLVAITEDGVALGDAGPRLVVPGDLRGGRYVSDVVTIKLAAAD